MIKYLESADGIAAQQLAGFFVGWPNPPKPETHLKMLLGSAHVELALDEETNMVVGFINAISDGVLAAYIPLLEVLPGYQGKGIGSELVRRMLVRLKHLYAIDLLCDEHLQGYYSGLGMQPAKGMLVRNYDRQSGA